MKDVIIILKILLLPIFLALALFRVIFNNSLVVNPFNLFGCMLAIIIIISEAQKVWKTDKEYNILRVIQILNMVVFIVLILSEFQFKFITPRWGDFISIISLGLSLSTEMIVKIINSIFKWRKSNNMHAYKTID